MENIKNMKITKYFIVLILLSGCERYEMISPPKLTGGKWIFTDYEVIITNSISDAKLIKNDTICINSFNNQTFLSGNFLMKQNFEQTAIDRRFIKGKTIWEFDSNNYYLYCDFYNGIGSIRPSHEPLWVNVYPFTKRISVDNTENGSVTNYTYETNDYGASPPTIMKLLSPPIVTDLYYSNGARDKAITIRVLLTFMR